jgi:hypothetical protein
LPPWGIPGDLRPILPPATAPGAKNRVLTATMDGAFHSICTYNAAQAPLLETKDRNRARLAPRGNRWIQPKAGLGCRPRRDSADFYCPRVGN